jgi:hypothetical protein
MNRMHLVYFNDLPRFVMLIQYYCARKRSGQLPGSRASRNQFAGRGKKGLVSPVLIKRVSWNPAEMGKP